MDYWLAKYNIYEGKEIANGVVCKYKDGYWITCDNKNELLGLININASTGPNWYNFVESASAALCRLKMLQDFIKSEYIKKYDNILALSPSVWELKYLCELTDKVYVTDVHDPYLNVLLADKSLTETHLQKIKRIESVDLNVMSDVDKLCFSDVIISVMVINYIEKPHELLKLLRKKCNRLIVGTWLKLCIRTPDPVYTEDELNDKGGGVLYWDSQIGMHCSTRGEKWVWTEKYFLQMLHDCGFTLLKVSRPRNNCLFVDCES